MRFTLAVLDEIKADGEKNGRGAVENGVEGGQVVNGQKGSFETCLASAMRIWIASGSEVR